MRSSRVLLISFLSLFVVSCGGSSSGDGTTVVQGMLTQGAAVSHSMAAYLKHGENENIENVTICALSECTVTDNDGLWGFGLPAEFQGGEVLFNLNGHGIDANVTIELPAQARDIFIHFQHEANGEVILHHMEVDGVRQETPGHHG